MKEARYVRMDPTGNITCLVTDTLSPGEQKAATRALLSRCEQVGYLVPARSGQAKARLEMMGGEFCGNASMAAAVYLAAREGTEGPAEVPLEVSGTEGIVRCRVRRLPSGEWEGTVEMPPVRPPEPFMTDGIAMKLVRMDGIAHLILKDHPLPDEEAEALLLRAASLLPEPCAGLLQWDSAAHWMKPLVYVKESRSMVWETGCGSGSTAVGVLEAFAKGDGVHSLEICQPGGVIRTEAGILDGGVRSVRITGLVRVGETGAVQIED